MDRRSRRYVLSTDGLEGRQLMTAIAPSNTPSLIATNPAGPTAAGVQVEGAGAVQQTIEAKKRHIENLPHFIGMLDKDGAVPQPTVQAIQADLDSFVGSLHPANPSLVSSFNLDLRKGQRYESINAGIAKDLNRDFGAILISTGVRAPTVTDLQHQMANLVNYDTTQPNPMITASNGYATILELGLGSGRPLVYPNVPSLLGIDHNGGVGKVPVTHNHRPSLTGNYAIGTDVQIVDVSNQVVLGQAQVNPANSSSPGTYAVRFHENLPDGTYTVRVRAEDSGYLSDPSPQFTFEVVTPPASKKK